MAKASFECLNFAGSEPLRVFDIPFTVATSPIATGRMGTHFWNHARAQEGDKQLAAIRCHGVTQCTFVVLTARVPGEYPLTWSFHAPPGSLPGSTGMGTVAASVATFYQRVADESTRLDFAAEFDLLVAGIEAATVDVPAMVAELEKNTAIKSVRSLVHRVTGYKCETFARGTWQFDADGGIKTSTEEHTCYDMYFFPTQSVDGRKVLVTKGRGKNAGKVHTVRL